MIGMAFLHTCKSCALRSNTTISCHTFVKNKVWILGLDGRVPWQRMRGEMPQGHKSKSAEIPTEEGFGRAAYRHMQRRALSLDEPEKQGHPVKRIYLEDWDVN